MDIDIQKLYNENLGFEDDIDEYTTDKDTDLIEEEQPFKADLIRIDQQMLSLKYVYELYQDGVLLLDPDFQRQYVWDDRKRKSRLIESLMLRIPIPAFYFYERDDARFLVIDGQQRLKTIFDFLDGEFKLFGLEYLGNQYNNCRFTDIDPKYQQRIKRTQLNINILDERSPQRVIYDIFRRVNSGGMPLNPQEMRNALCSKKVRTFLRKGANCPEFLTAIRNKINDLRFDRQETFLRFVTLYRRYDFNNYRLMKLSPTKLINLMDQEVVNLEKISESEEDSIYEAFRNSMKRCQVLFGQYAFVNISCDQNNSIRVKRDLINKPLLIAFSVLLADSKLNNMDLCNNYHDVVNKLATKLMDNSYQNSISKATGDEGNIIICFEKTLEVLRECEIISQ